MHNERLKKPIISGQYQDAEQTLMTKCLTLEFNLIPETFIEIDYENFAEGLIKRAGVNSKISRQ